MRFPRASGILLHPTSLPGGCGIGDLGDEAAHFIEFLAASGQTVWQVLPLGPTGYGDSPYQCLSLFAGNELVVSPRRLVDLHLLSSEDLVAQSDFPADRVDFTRARALKNELLKKAFTNFEMTSDVAARKDFEEFCEKAASWLNDYALFRALKDAHEGRAWHTWEPGLARREASALEHARERLQREVNAQSFYQYLFFRQWSALKSLCRAHRIRVIGDMPIFAAHDSADVWANPELFKLDEAGRPRVVAGVPPDYFSSTGQLWGNPIYNWERMKQDGFTWWIRRVRAMLEMFDILRLDHFRGFAATWEVPGGDATAEHGQWVAAPGRELFLALTHAHGALPLMAEDLGVITPDVEALRDEFVFPGMRILQFAFGSDSRNPHLPHMYINNSAVYTGTHDNDTALGWFTSLADTKTSGDRSHLERTREYCLRYLNSNGEEINWDMIRVALASVADTAITPLQDVLSLGSEARMNLPASQGGNWNWRFREGLLTDNLADRLRGMCEIYGRTTLTA